MECLLARVELEALCLTRADALSSGSFDHFRGRHIQAPTPGGGGELSQTRPRLRVEESADAGSL